MMLKYPGNYKLSVNDDGKITPIDLSKVMITYDHALKQAYILGLNLYDYSRNNSYTIEVQNIKTADGVTISAPYNTVSGTVCYTPGEIDISHIVATGDEIKVFFDFDRKIKEETAMNPSNYTIYTNTVSSTNYISRDKYTMFYDYRSNSVTLKSVDLSNPFIGRCRIDVGNIEAAYGNSKESFTNKAFLGYTPTMNDVDFGIDFFTDISIEHKYYKSITWAKQNHYADGYVNRKFKSNIKISRGEFLKFNFLSSGRGKETDSGKWGDKRYLDDPGKDNLDYDYSQNESWMWPYIYKATTDKFVNGYPDKYFRPNNTINLAECVKIMVNVFELDKFKNDSLTDWREKYKLFLTEGKKNNDFKAFSESKFWIDIDADSVKWDEYPNRGELVDMVRFACSESEVSTTKKTRSFSDNRNESIDNYEYIAPSIRSIKLKGNIVICEFTANATFLDLEDIYLIIRPVETYASNISIVKGEGDIYILKTLLPKILEGTYDILLDVYGEISYKEEGLIIGESLHDVKNASILVIDVSGSMSGTGITAAKAAANNYLDLISNGDLLGIVKFSSSASIVMEMTEISEDNRQNIKTSINNLSTGGGTNLAVGVNLAKQLLDNLSDDFATNSVLLMTDGKGGTDEENLNAANNLSKDSQILYSVGLGSSINSNILREMAKLTEGRYFLSPTGDELASVFGNISDLASDRSVILNNELIIEPNGQAKETIINVDSSVGDNLFIRIYAKNGQTIDQIETNLVSPEGTTISEENLPEYIKVNRTQGASYLSWNIQNPLLGAWKILISYKNLQRKNQFRNDGGIEINLTVSADSMLDLTVGKFDKTIYQQGELIHIPVSISTNIPIIGAKVQADICYKNETDQNEISTIYLYDDGRHADNGVNDGIYGADYILKNSGEHVFTIKANGELSNNDPFTRQTEFAITVSDDIIDADNDSIPDFWEEENYLPTNEDNSKTDFDNDNLTDYDEYLNNTIPYLIDSDNDQLSDGDEINKYFTNPSKFDSDGDSIPDNIEIVIESNPNIVNTDITFYDLNYDLVLDELDIALIESKWNLKSGDNAFQYIYDLTDDNIINVVDIMKVSGQYQQVLNASNSNALTSDSTPLTITINQVSSTLDNIEIEIQTNKTSSIGGYQFNIKFDSSLLELKSIDHGIIFPSSKKIRTLGPKGSSGNYDTACYSYTSSFQEKESSNYDAPLAKVSFTAKEEGKSEIEISDLLLVDNNYKPATISTNESATVEIEAKKEEYDDDDNNFCFISCSSCSTYPNNYALIYIVALFVVLSSHCLRSIPKFTSSTK